MNRIMIAGVRSGCGKTSITCSMLQALINHRVNAVSFKCGPDYIDPMFHSKVIGVKACNLDSFFCDDNTLKYLFTENSQGFDISIVEGVMGFYDGAGSRASSYFISQILNIPTVIVIDCKGISDSLGAVMKGFLTYRQPNNIVGFIFNCLPKKLTDAVKKMCEELGTEYLGFMPYNSICRIESRHLGLITADEVCNLKDKIQSLSDMVEENINIDRIISLAQDCPQLYFNEPDICNICSDGAVRIAVARDDAFCFIYEDNLKMLKKLGCEIMFFSPLKDKHLPENIDGIILSGGYPELYAERLAKNKSMLNEISSAICGKIPIIAECGGFMYLHNFICCGGRKHELTGIVDGEVYKTDKLQRFGYINITAKRDCMLCRKGETIKAHEFHYWESSCCGNDFIAEKESNKQQWRCIHANNHIYAGFPHIYFYSDTRTAVNFVRRCIIFKNGKNK